MSTAVITADVGGIDIPQHYEPQRRETVMYQFREDNLPYPMPNLDNRLKAKYIKIMMHRAVQGYDNYIWIDGRVSILHQSFTEKFTPRDLFDVVICRHPIRGDVFEELEYIMDMMRSGNKYLTDRYANQQMEKEYAFYKSEGLPKAYPLYACTLFGRGNTPVVNNFMNEWWLRTLEFSYFDQAMFSYVAWKQKLNIYELHYDDFNGTIFKTGQHK